ncbi:MAG: 30S ribosomal protein S9 [Candidatus Omnitrophica bacterium]|nr:30S ribosomal protein S9 [Candidatus Omnitrophota bacterium]
MEVVKFAAIGRRKTSTARIMIMPGTGKIAINGRGFEDYFTRETDRIIILTPLRLTSAVGKFDIEANVAGGGLSGQAGALRLALSRALTLFDQNMRPVLKKNTCLRRDARMKERKKPGQKGARRKFQWVKR